MTLIPPVGSIIEDPLGNSYAVLRASVGELMCKRGPQQWIIATELFRPGTGWRVTYNPADYGGRKSWEW